MPIYFTDFAHLPEHNYGKLDVAKSLGEGLDVGAKPYDIYARQRKEALANIIGAVTAQYAEPTALAKMQNLGAQRQQYLARALLANTNAQIAPEKAAAYIQQAGAATNLNNLKSQLLPEQTEADIQAKLASAGASNASASNSKALAALNTLKLTQPQKLAPGTSYTDSQGNVHITPTAKTASAQQAAESMGVTRDYLANASPITYIGTGAAARLAQDRIAVSDPNAPQAVKAKAAENLINNAVGYQIINEVVAANLNAQNIRSTDSNVKHMRDSLLQGTTLAAPPTLDNLPPSLQAEAKRRFNAIQQEASAKRNMFYNQGFPTDDKGYPAIDLTSSVQHYLPSGYQMPQPIKLPTFKSKADYEAYLHRLTPQEQAQVIASMRGK